MSKFLVTGGAGFVGSHLVERLLKDGHKVTVLDDFSTGTEANLAAFEGADLRVVKGCVLDGDTVSKCVRGVEYILHLAAVPSIQRSVKDPVRTNDVNVGGTLTVLEHARRNKSVKRVVMASSSSVYGDSPTLPKVESMAAQPVSPYAVSKLAAEQYCRAYHATYGLETVALRYFNIFGPRQDPQSDYAAVVPKFITAMIARRKPFIYGDGKQTRDFTYVENVVHANLQACAANKVAGEVLNVACGERVTIAGLANMIGEVVGWAGEPRIRDPRPSEVRHSLADISRSEDLLGYRVRVSLHQGLAQTVEWYQQNA
jgi:UDP-glucose 4-epimerase